MSALIPPLVDWACIDEAAINTAKTKINAEKCKFNFMFLFIKFELVKLMKIAQS